MAKKVQDSLVMPIQLVAGDNNVKIYSVISESNDIKSGCLFSKKKVASY